VDVLSSILGEKRKEQVASLVETLRSPQPWEALKVLDDLWRGEKANAILALRERSDVRSCFWMLAACDHSDWVRPLGNALTEVLLLSDRLKGTMERGRPRLRRLR
jgi:hypothetical protein